MKLAIGQGFAFDECDGNELSQLSVIRAEDGYVYITVTSESGALRFICRKEQALAIAAAIEGAATP